MSEKITCEWKFTVFEGDNGYVIYRYYDKVNKTEFLARGYYLPAEKYCDIILIGDWQKKSVDKGKMDRTFEVESFDVILPKTTAFAIEYLKSLKCGIGQHTAELLVNAFGPDLWDIIEKAPEKLKKTKGCKRIDVDKLVANYQETIMMRKLLAMFQDVEGIKTRQISNVINKLGSDAAGKIERNPYILVPLGFDFDVSEAIAKKTEFDRNRPERISAAVISVLTRAETEGHLYLPIALLINRTQKMISKDGNELNNSEEQIRSTIKYLGDTNSVVNEEGSVYRKFRYDEECDLAANITRLSTKQKPKTSEKLDEYISQYELKNNIQLDQQQKQAIKDSFDSCVHIITGGPGTGKTTILKGILYCHALIAEEYNFQCNPILMAPTGRAARRMTEATGYASSTIHKALGLRGESEDVEQTVVTIDASIVIVDEASMIDNHIANLLFKAIPSQTQLIIVGDVDQLPSVGCGNVLRELINCRCVSKTRLNTIHRQASGNVIITNSKKIRDGELNLEWTENFFFTEANTNNDVMNKTCSLYYDFVDKYGLDNVVLLNPYRRKGDISVNKFNKVIQDALNPLKSGQKELTASGITYRVGDRIMQTKNTDLVSNGDIGYISNIQDVDGDNGKSETICTLQFADAAVKYNKKEMEDVSLAYCTTIHKSQGAEYDHVIIVMHPSHQIMLRRNLIYTAVTRAKKRVAIVGTWDAMQTAITTNVVDSRNTKLGSRIRSMRGVSKCQIELATLMQKKLYNAVHVHPVSRLENIQQQ